jgi:diguanylate cyclase (GGDEF)-like protein
MFTREALSARRTKRPLAVGIIDLDRFKSINDTHGHASGDEVLARVARVLGETLRRTDIVGRWGGEELVAVMPDTDLASARLALERCLVATRALAFRGKADQPFDVTFSGGAVLVGDDEKLDAAVARADRLLYAAKEAGRDRVLV